MKFSEAYCTDTFGEVLKELLRLSYPLELIHLLEDNTENLFATEIKTVHNEDGLYLAMLLWADVCYKYIRNKDMHATNEDSYTTAPKIRATKSKKYKEEHFKKDMESILLSLGAGGGVWLKPKGYKLKEILEVLLEDAYHNPNEYIAEKLHIQKASDNNVDIYLRRLGLENKSNIIKAFCIKLTNLTF